MWNWFGILAEFPDQYYAEAMDSLYLPMDEAMERKRKIDTKKLKYVYLSFDGVGAARKSGSAKDFLKKVEVEVYPDTAVWVKDFNYSYNDPMHQDYFWHQAYNEYPVVGVSWNQAKAFCDFRTQKRNDFLHVKRKEQVENQVSDYQQKLNGNMLPEEAWNMPNTLGVVLIPLQTEVVSLQISNLKEVIMQQMEPLYCRGKII